MAGNELERNHEAVAEKLSPESNLNNLLTDGDMTKTLAIGPEDPRSVNPTNLLRYCWAVVR